MTGGGRSPIASFSPVPYACFARAFPTCTCGRSAFVLVDKCVP
jgi:hypothetical protein